MTALAKGTARQQLPNPENDSGPIADNVIVYQGSGVMLDTAGRARPGGVLAGGYGVGCALPRDFSLDRYDNTGVGHAAGAMQVKWREGVFGFANDVDNPVLATTPPGTALYFVDDNTLSLSSLNGTRAPAGRHHSYDANAPRPVFCQMSKAIGLQLVSEMTVARTKLFAFTGRNAAGAITLTGAKVGDKVVGVADVAAGSVSAAASFESTITVADQIQQSSASNLSAVKYLVILESNT